jgi:hypothetical protein
MPRLPSSRSRSLYNVRERELGSACVGGHLGRPGDRADRNPSHSLVRPCGAFSRPGRSISMPSRTAAVKTGPVQGRRRLGLDGREHDGTLARHGHGRSPLRSMTLNSAHGSPLEYGILLTSRQSAPCMDSHSIPTRRASSISATTDQKPRRSSVA